MPYTEQTDDSNSMTVGVEIADSGTVIRVAVQNATGTRYASARVARPATPDQVLTQINQLIEQTCQSRDDEHHGNPVLGAIGVVVWGSVDATRRTIVSLRHNHEWRDVNLAEVLSDTWRCPVRVESAVGAIALAEVHPSLENVSTPMLYLLPERSLSAVLIKDGKIDATTGGDPSRFGHWPVPGGIRRCSCGSTGHLETVASAQAIVRNMIGLASTDDISYEAMMRASGGRAETMSAAQVAGLARNGDPTASHVMAEAIQALGPILAGLVIWHDIPTIIIGGILASAEESYLRPLREEIARHLGRICPMPGVRGAKTTGNAALHGALMIARQRE